MEPALEVVLLPRLVGALPELEIVCVGQRWETAAEVIMIGTSKGIYAYEAGKIKVLWKIESASVDGVTGKEIVSEEE